MPTFLLFKDGKQIEEIKGADPRKLKTVIEGVAADLKSSGVAPQKVQEKEKTMDDAMKDDQRVQEKKAAGADDGLSMLERLMQRKK